MSVLIRGMEMPTSCDDCRFAVDGWCYACIPESDAERQRITTNYCPLAHVPEHGRLGDLDELYSRLERWYQTYKRALSESEEIYIRAMLAGVKGTPTIIPESEDRE